MIIDKIALTLVILCGINRGIIGVFNIDLMEYVLGSPHELLARVVYSICGIAAVWCVTLLFTKRRETPVAAPYGAVRSK